MNPNDQTPPLGQPSTAEEDIALQAIESLDVEESETSIESIPAASQAQSTSTANTRPAPTVASPINDIKAMPPATEGAPTMAVPVSSPANDTLTAANAEPAVPTQAFQPFTEQKSARKPFKTVLIIILVLTVLGVGAYFGWQYYQSTLTPSSNATAQPEQTQNTTVPTDTEAAVNEDISELEALMQGMSDDELSDDTLSDDALYN